MESRTARAAMSETHEHHNLTIKRANDFESLIIEFNKDNFVIPLELQTKPILKITWGTSLELQR